MNESYEINIGDTVVDRLTHQRMQVLDIFDRDNVTLYTLGDGHGSTTDVTKNWISKIGNGQ